MKKYITLLLLLAAAFTAAAQDSIPRLNKKNLVVKEWNTDARSGRKVLDHVTTYNSDGRKVEEVEYNTDGQKWRKRYEWGEDGKISKELVYDERNRLVNIKKFEYNVFGRKKIQYTYDAKGKLKSIKDFEYIAGDA